MPGSVKDLNCVAWKLKLTEKAEAILKELLVDEEEDPQVAIETKEIEEAEIYNRIKEDMDRLPEDKQKELRQHIQGILWENAMAHLHVAEVADHLAEVSWLLSMPGIVVLSQATAQPLIGAHLPLMNTFLEEAKKKREETIEQHKLEYRPIDEICIDQNLPRLAREWEFQHEGPVNSRLAAVITWYIHEAMMRDKKKFYSGTALGEMFKIPPSTLNKLISGRLYMGGVELDKYHEEMKRKGINIKK